MMIIILALIIVAGAVFYATKFSKNISENTSRPPENTIPTQIEVNDKLILVNNVNHDDIKVALTKFCNMYNKDDYAALPRLTRLSQNSFAVTFPYNVDFTTFCFAINFLEYPTDINWDAKVKAWATTRQGDDWITDKSANKKVMLFISEDDEEYDNVFMTTEDGTEYKLGFRDTKQKQLLANPKETYISPSIEFKSLEGLAFEDFK